MANDEAVALLQAMLVEDEAAYNDHLARLKAAGWDGATGVIAAAFVGACQRRFGADPDPHAIRRFVADACQAPGSADLDPETAEVLIWATFRHEERADQIDPQDVVPAELILIHKLISDVNLSPEQVEQFLMYVVMLADQAG